MQRQKISTVASLLIAQLQAYKLKPTLAQVTVCGVIGDGCPVLGPTSDNHPTINDVLPETPAQNTTQSQNIYSVDIGATTPIVIQVKDSDDENKYFVDKANQPVVVKVVTDETGKEIVLINDVKKEPIVIDALAEKDTVVEIIQNNENNTTNSVNVIENASSDTPTVTHIDQPGQTLVPVQPDVIEVIPKDVTILEPKYNDDGELQKICIEHEGKTKCTNTEDLVIQHTAEEKIILDVTIPAGVEEVIKIVNGDSQGIDAYIDPKEPNVVVVDIGTYATSDVEIKIAKDEDIEKVEVQLTDATNNQSQVTIEPIPQEFGATRGPWQEYNNNFEVRTCQTDGSCSQWRADPCSAREQKAQVDVIVPEGTNPIIKVVPSDNAGTVLHVDPTKPDVIVIDIGQNDPKSFEINVEKDSNIKQPEANINNKPVDIDPNFDPKGFAESEWIEVENCRQRTCKGASVNGGVCSDWEVNPTCVPEQVVVDIKVPLDTPVIQTYTGANTQPTVYEMNPNPSDPNSVPILVVDASEGVIVKKHEDEKTDTVNATINGTPTSVTPIEGTKSQVIIVQDQTETVCYVADKIDPEYPLIYKVEDQKPIETPVDSDKPNPGEKVVGTLEIVTNKQGDIIGTINDGVAEPLKDYVPDVPPKPTDFGPNITDGKDITSTTKIIVVQAISSIESAVFIVTDKQSDKNIIVVYTSDEKPTINVLADQSGKIAAVAVNSNQIAPVVIGDLQFGPAVIINKSTQDAPQTYVISDTTTTNSKSDIQVIDPTTATIVTPDNLIQLIEENIVDLFSIQADPKSPSGIMVCNENNDCKCGETYVSPEKAAGQDITPITPTITVPSQTDQTNTYTVIDDKGVETIIVVTPNPKPEVIVIDQGEDKKPLVIVDGDVTTPTDLGNAEDGPTIITTTDSNTDEDTISVVQDKNVIGQVNTDTHQVQENTQSPTIDTNTVQDALTVTTNWNGDVVVQDLINKITIQAQTPVDTLEIPTKLAELISENPIKAEGTCDEAQAKIAEQEKKIKELEEELAKFE